MTNDALREALEDARELLEGLRIDYPLSITDRDAVRAMFAKIDEALSAIDAIVSQDALREALDKLEGLRVMCESSSQPLHVQILTEVIEALSAVETQS